MMLEPTAVSMDTLTDLTIATVMIAIDTIVIAIARILLATVVET